jgi:hypothetical protein
MEVSERLGFNIKIMDFCLRGVHWKQEGNQENYISAFNWCVEKSIIAEQIFRAELKRPRPGILVKTPEDE